MSSKSRSWIGLVGLVMALAVAGVSALYLRGVQKTVKELAVEATSAPPPGLDLTAPQLFPGETRLFLAAHGIDRSWDDFEVWQKLFEPTAAAHALRGMLDDPRGLPPEVRSSLDEIDRSLDEMEARFGYRPTTRDFFQTYGKDTAIGVLPGAAPGDEPGLLAVIRMPGEKATDLFETRLSNHSDVKLAQPPAVHGFPLFQEDREGFGTIYYGVGRSFLFLGQQAAPVIDALGRLRKLLDGEAVTGTLADDPVFKRGVPDPWDEVRFALHVRRDAPFGDWKEELKPLDEYIANGFILAGDDPAIAVSSIETAEGWEMRSSFPFDPSKEWIDLVPADSERVNLTVPVSQDRLQEAWGPALERFAKRPIWKELDALLGDGPRLERLLKEALPPGATVDGETRKRLTHDAAFVAALWRSVSESAMAGQTFSVVVANKSYGTGEDVGVQTVVGMETDPLTVYHLAAALELGRTYAEDAIRLERFPEGLVWSLDLEGLAGGPLTAMGVEAGPIMEEITEPALILSSGRVFLVLGAALREEIVDLLSGKGTPLREDPIFKAAFEGTPADWQMLDYQRPAKEIQTAFGAYRQMAEARFGETQGPEAMPGEGMDLVAGVFGCLDRLATILSPLQATLTATYPGGSKHRVTQVDPEAEKSVPMITLPAAAPEVVDLLPDTTWFLTSGRIRTAGVVDDLEEVFLEGIGGKENWDAFRGSGPGPGDELIDRFYETLVRGIDGEAGLAVAVPSGLPPQEQPGLTLQDVILRAPEVVIFVEYADPGAAFDVFASVLGKLNETLNPTPFEERLDKFHEGLGPPPTGASLVQEDLDGVSFAALDIMVPQGPMGEFMVYSVCCVRKGSHLFLTNGLSVFAHLIGTPDRTLPTLRSGLTKTFGADPFPAEAMELSVIRTDGLVDNVHLLVEPMIPMVMGMTLQGYGMEEPPQERIEAHMQGWARAVEVIEDLFRTETTSVAWSARTGDRVQWTWKESGPPSGSDRDAKPGK